MVPARIQPEQLAVQHVGKGGKRNPIGNLHVSKGPANRLGGQPLPHNRIGIDIGGVIVVNELKMRRLSKNRPNRQHQKNANTRRLKGLRVSCFRRRLSACWFHNSIFK